MKKLIFLTTAMLCYCAGFAQIGIGNTDPHASSILDVRSTTKGMLTPRMSSTERIAITSPANGLMVFDTTDGAFYYYNLPTTSWVKLSGEKDSRLKFKLIKSTDVLSAVLAAERTAGGNTKYLLDTGTYYEINGTINLDLPIELNNAYLSGFDSGEDKIVRASGDIFTGTTGGSVRLLTLTATAGNVFNLNGPGAIGAQTQTLIHRDCIMAGSQSIGTIQNFGLVFVSIVQYIGNTNGVIYRNINRLLLSNAAWFSSNSGTYEKIEGTFGLLTKQGGFSEVTGTKIGFDVSSNPVITGDAVLETVVFSGAVTSGKYINGYTTGTYAGFNFNNNWSVRGTNIPTEFDSEATGTVYLNRSGTAQAATNLPTINVNTKLDITSGLSNNLFRCSATTNNRVTYQGKKGRYFDVKAAVSFDVVTGTGNTEYAFFFMRIPAAGGQDPQVASEVVLDTNAGYIQAFPVQGSVYLNTGDSIELWFRRISTGGQNFRVKAYNMILD